jgi:ribosomal protein L29
MNLSKFTDISSLSKEELLKAILETETQLFNLRFKKATRQSFPVYEIKNIKRRLSQLKTLYSIKD